ncbi:pentatricopeptide repeat-containing protein [Quercus suber]|uniref:Pentatricopeptide repeat-containing protein n=1 Tax=Quercus suber TaxID=58331 RepID=A0AAW0JXK2_QUESU
MASQMAILTRTRTLFKSPATKSITTFTFLSQKAQLVELTHFDSPSPLPPPPPPPPTATTPLPPNPASGSPLFNENWRSPISNSPNSRNPRTLTSKLSHKP